MGTSELSLAGWRRIVWEGLACNTLVSGIPFPFIEKTHGYDVCSDVAVIVDILRESLLFFISGLLHECRYFTP